MNDFGAVLAALLTLFILSYLIGDNPFYRLAASLFVGLTAGYAVVVALSNVIWPQMLVPLGDVLQNFDPIRSGLAVITFVLSITLVFKLFASTTRPASCVTALMVGVGVAVAIGGSLVGTLIPQIQAAFIPLWSTKGTASWLEILESALDGFFMVVGTVATLWFFYYGGRARPGLAAERPGWVKALAPVGEVFLGTTFGVMYAGAIVASLAVFAQSWLNVLQGLQALWNLRSFIGLP
jgi:hypothetical protein